MHLCRPSSALPILLAMTVGACSSEPTPTSSQSFALTAEVERWRELVEKHFKYQNVTWALNIIACESGGDPNAYNSGGGYSGLFQCDPSSFPEWARAAGFPGAGPFEAEANIAVAAYVVSQEGSAPWECKYSPFEDFSYQPQFYKDGVPLTASKDVGAAPPSADAGATIVPTSDYGSGLPAADSEPGTPIEDPSPTQPASSSGAEPAATSPTSGPLVGGCSLTASHADRGPLLFVLALLPLLRRRRN